MKSLPMSLGSAAVQTIAVSAPRPVPPTPMASVPGDAAKAENDARVLNGAVGIIQGGSRRADPRHAQPGDELCSKD